MFGNGPSLLSTEGSTLAAAPGWVHDLLLGTSGVVVAVIAIAGIGFAMLQGRIAWRYSVRAVLGCFILFGAPLIAAGLLRMAESDSASSAKPIVALEPITIPSRPAPPADPYAGASLPTYANPFDPASRASGR